MELSEILSEVTALDAAGLQKVGDLVQALLGDHEACEDDWESAVWAAIRLCSTREHCLPLPPAHLAMAMHKRKKLLTTGAAALYEFLTLATGDDHIVRLRPSLNFVVSVAVRHMKRRNIPLTINTLLQTLPSFPAYFANAFPGATATPKQFFMIRTLHAKRRGV